ncbi:sensor histidine kinase [Enterococcus sp. AZ109]|uniref:sensor histidine kinase n=1 Tax=Enterococcus sp. AZ109 TaxID=2774634 RepID=UPI003F2454FA
MLDGKSLLLIVLGFAAIGAIAALFWQRWQFRQTMNRLLHMLDSAIEGNFKEESYDESLYSAVENKMRDYLSATEVSNRSIAVEKDEIKQLIADISHQTKTPIANLLLYGQLLAEQELPEESRRFIGEMNKQGEKLNFLIAALVKLSRLETGILAVHPEQHNIQRMLEEVAAQFHPEVQRKNIQLQVDPTKEQAIFDPKWTAEAIANLVDNAIKYTPSGGKIQITVYAYELFCRIDIADTGIGFSESEQAKIFTRFYRSAKVAQVEGLGIGLYITRQIIAAQNGYMKVSSTPGQGSVFSVFLPRSS